MTNCPACRQTCAPAPGSGLPWQCPHCRTNVVGRYCDLAWIGAGSLGDVYSARQPEMGNRTVAIKIPHGDEPRARARFRRAIAAAERLQHENIVRAFECGEEAGRVYLVMEFVDGASLVDVVAAESGLSSARALRILRGLAAALAHAARQHIVHGHMRPENVLLTADGSPKILDYEVGLAEDVLDTSPYSAPEQFAEPRCASVAADLYSLGCTMFFCLTGQPPFADCNAAELARQHAQSLRPSIRNLRPDVPVELDKLIQPMMNAAPVERPSPDEILSAIDQILSGRPSSRAPAPPAAAVLLDAACPHCGEVYHLQTELLGKRIQRLKRECGQRFVVQPLGASPARSLGLSTSSGQAPSPGGGKQVFEAELVSAPHDSWSEPPPIQSPRASAALPRAAPAGSPLAEPASKTQPPRRRVMHLAVVAFIALTLLGGGVTGWKVYRQLNPTPDVAWAQAQDQYQNKKWSEARAAFEAFRINWPNEPQAGQVPFFLAMCDVGKRAYSDTQDAGSCLRDLDGVFQKFRDQPVYALYPSDLYSTDLRLIERLTEQARATLDLAQLARAREAFELLSTIAQSMRDDWVPRRTAELGAHLHATEQFVHRARGLREAIDVLRKQIAAGAEPNPDDAYAKVKTLEAEHPEIAQDKQFAALLQQTYQMEAKRVRYEVADTAQDPAAAKPEAGSPGMLVAVGGSPGRSAPETGNQPVVTALARGVLYVFNTNGEFLWARRLGPDSYGLPARIDATATSPPLLIAPASQDRALLAMDATDGRVVWQHSVEQDISMPPTIVSIAAEPNAPAKRRALLPTANGEIRVLELSRGRELGRYRLGCPLTSGGASDPTTKLVYFAADSKRVFAINPLCIDRPEQPACRSVLFTDHASGSLRSEPLVIPPYLILAEGTGLDAMRVRAFAIGESGFAGVRAPALAEQSLAGWSWFPPCSTPDRVALVTDRGALGLFGVNLDNREEAIYPLIEPARGQKSAVLASDGGDVFPSLAVECDEHSLWVVSNGRLTKLAFDILNQQIKPGVAAAAEVNGIPVQPAQIGPRGKTFFLNLMSRDGRGFALSAIDSESGAELWRRELGLSLLGEPIVLPDRVVLVDHAGRTFDLIPSRLQTPTDDAQMVQPTARLELPAPASATQMMRLGSPTRPTHLAAVIDEGKRLTIRSLADGQAATETVSLPDTLCGLPCLINQILAVPCSDGLLHLVPVNRATRLASPPTFRWSDAGRPAAAEMGTETAQLYAANSDGLLLLDERARRVRRLTLRKVKDVLQWSLLGTYESPDPLHEPLQSDGLVYFADASGSLVCLRLSNLALVWKCPLGGRVSAAPVLGAGCILAVVDDRRVSCVPTTGEGALRQPTWISTPLDGRIRGKPALIDDLLVVADNSQHVTGLRLSDGAPRWQVRLPGGSSASGSVAPFGKGRILVPLDDGTLTLLAVPDSTASATEEMP
jgi:serine/threonine protein kinase/outer membrane protein assembly factor BamB